jgi:hypothetical protein
MLIKSFNLMICLTVLACAADRNRIISERQYPGLPLDTSALRYVDMESGEELALADYMVSNKLRAMLLVFGAAGCVKCTEKSQELSKHYLNRHNLFLGKHQASFELMGITTDQGSGMRLFESRWKDADSRENWGYNYIRWNDPGGESVKNYLLSPGEDFQVPFTVLITREQILWKIAASEKITVEEMLNQVEAILDGQAAPRRTEPEIPEPPIVAPPPIIKGEKPTPPVEGLYPWLTESPNRFDQYPVKDCANQDRKLNLQSGEVHWLYLVPENCDGVCRANLLQLQSMQSHCQAASGGTSLANCLVHVIFPQDQSALCQQSWHYRGSELLSAGFASHFDWRIDAVLDPNNGLPIRPEKFDEPMLMAFLSSGKLVSSHLGAVTKDQLIAEMNQAHFSERPIGANFRVVGDNQAGNFVGNIDFEKVLPDAEITVVAGFDVGCSSCVEEMQHWSLKNGLLDYCRNSDSFCQLFALETYPPYNETAEQMYHSIRANMANLGIRVPVWVDRQLFGGEFSRFFESYLSAKNPQWHGLPGTAIYDREGKIIAAFRSEGKGGDDKVFAVVDYLHRYRLYLNQSQK